jgi:predicted PurR-regulated permease PerM
LQSGAWRNAATNAHFARVVFDAQGFNAWSSYKKNPTKFTTGKLDPIPANAADVAAAKNQGILGTGLSIPNPVSAGIDSLGSTLTKVASNIATVLIALVLLVLGVLFAMHKDVRGAVKSIPKVLPI